MRLKLLTSEEILKTFARHFDSELHTTRDNYTEGVFWYIAFNACCNISFVRNHIHSDTSANSELIVSNKIKSLEYYSNCIFIRMVCYNVGIDLLQDYSYNLSPRAYGPITVGITDLVFL